MGDEVGFAANHENVIYALADTPLLSINRLIASYLRLRYFTVMSVLDSNPVPAQKDQGGSFLGVHHRNFIRALSIPSDFSLLSNLDQTPRMGGHIVAVILFLGDDLVAPKPLLG
jgi:hypothetical protein